MTDAILACIPAGSAAGAPLPEADVRAVIRAAVQPAAGQLSQADLAAPAFGVERRKVPRVVEKVVLRLEGAGVVRMLGRAPWL